MEPVSSKYVYHALSGILDTRAGGGGSAQCCIRLMDGNNILLLPPQVHATDVDGDILTYKVDGYNPFYTDTFFSLDSASETSFGTSLRSKVDTVPRYTVISRYTVINRVTVIN